jgi:transcriptional regulator with XRE-family HTH domain
LINLKYWRKRKSLSQGKLAALVETSQSYIAEIESFRKIPSITMIYKFAKVLDLCPKDLLICKCDKCKNVSTY